MLFITHTLQNKTVFERCVYFYSFGWSWHGFDSMTNTEMLGITPYSYVSPTDDVLVFVNVARACKRLNNWFASYIFQSVRMGWTAFKHLRTVVPNNFICWPTYQVHEENVNLKWPNICELLKCLCYCSVLYQIQSSNWKHFLQDVQCQLHSILTPNQRNTETVQHIQVNLEEFIASAH